MTTKELIRGAEQGDAVLQLRIGLACRFGDGVPQDDVKAFRWFQLAAEQGNARAQYLDPFS